MFVAGGQNIINSDGKIIDFEANYAIGQIKDAKRKIDYSGGENGRQKLQDLFGLPQASSHSRSSPRRLR